MTRYRRLERSADPLCRCEYWDCTGDELNRLAAWAREPRAHDPLGDAASEWRLLVARTRANACIVARWQDLAMPPQIEAAVILGGVEPGLIELHDAMSELVSCDRLSASERAELRDLMTTTDALSLSRWTSGDDRAMRKAAEDYRKRSPCRAQ